MIPPFYDSVEFWLVNLAFCWHMCDFFMPIDPKFAWLKFIFSSFSMKARLVEIPL